MMFSPSVAIAVSIVLFWAFVFGQRQRVRVPA